jgi:hypothetical protein
MPFYDFMNKETREVHQLMMSISKLDAFKEQNPHLKQLILSAPSVVSGTGGLKNDEGWKENLARIAEAHPHSALAEKQGGRSSTKAKVSEIATKHGLNKRGKYKMDEL